MFLSALTTHYFSKLRQFSEHSRWCFPAKLYDAHVDFVVINKKVGHRQSRFKNRKQLTRHRRYKTLVLSEDLNGETPSLVSMLQTPICLGCRRCSYLSDSSQRKFRSGNGPALKK